MSSIALFLLDVDYNPRCPCELSSAPTGTSEHGLRTKREGIFKPGKHELKSGVYLVTNYMTFTSRVTKTLLSCGFFIFRNRGNTITFQSFVTVKSNDNWRKLESQFLFIPREMGVLILVPSSSSPLRVTLQTPAHPVYHIQRCSLPFRSLGDSAWLPLKRNYIFPVIESSNYPQRSYSQNSEVASLSLTSTIGSISLTVTTKTWTVERQLDFKKSYLFFPPFPFYLLTWRKCSSVCLKWDSF